MTFKRWISFILILSLVTPTSWAQTPDHQRAQAESLFLKDLFERTRVFVHMNYTKISTVLDCIKSENPQLDRAVCDKEVSFIQREISINYPKSRQHLFLSQLFHWENMGALLTVLYSSVLSAAAGHQSPIYVKLENLSWDHPLDYILQQEDIVYANWSNQEVESGLNGLVSNGQKDLRGFNQIFPKACRDLYQTPVPAEKIFGASARPLDPQRANLCNQITLQFDSNKRSFYFKISGSLPKGAHHDMNVLKSFFSGTSLSLKDKFRSAYLGLIQIVPYIGLIKSANPTRSDLIAAFSFMKQTAQKIVQEFDQEQKFYRSTTPPQSRSSMDRWKWLSLFRYDPIAKDLLVNPGQGMDLMPAYPFEDLQKDLLSEYENNQLIKIVGQGVAVMAGQLLICYAGGRIVGAVSRLSRFSPGFKKLCIPMSTIPVNVGFVLESLHNYSITYHEVFASTGHKQLLREIEALDSADLDVVISAVMVPVGATLALQYIARLAHRLSKSGFAQLSQSVEKAQGQLLKAQ